MQTIIDLLRVLVGNQSIVDVGRLSLKSEQEAREFVQAYGFDVRDVHDQKKLLYYYRRAFVFLTEKFDVSEDKIPSFFKKANQIDHLLKMLLLASGRSFEPGLEEECSVRELQYWSCVLLRIMHAFIHAENDLFHLFSEEIQKQILTPVQNVVITQGPDAKPYLKGIVFGQEGRIELVRFEVKPHKTSVSSVIKLLAKAETHMIDIHDKIGVRFVTKNLIDVFRVLLFLIENHIVSPAHVMAGQTTNTIYPIDLLQTLMLDHDEKRNLFYRFLTVANSSDLSLEERKLYDLQERDLIEFLEAQLDGYREKVEFVRKENRYSAKEYQFIKFVERRLIRLPNSYGSGRFFYPFEIQILTEAGYQRAMEGEGDHINYKQRQLAAAKARVLMADQLLEENQ
ncbi:MAG: TIGR04552 family protein [Bdellovibrionaceae bacterium]|nr:TIGR04552 family protein [Pseudobdellovibrionaceae bacterium]MDW8190564.1 TIGR04552 family protein [Pseudobdellovibrionaceae bacterium]